MKQRALLKYEAPILRSIDVCTGQVCRQQVGRKLHAVKIRLDAVGQYFDCPGFCKTRRAFDEQMSVGKQRDQQPVHERFLADNNRLTKA